MSWNLIRGFGRRREPDADIACRDAKILRLTAAGDRLNQELNHARRELAEERGKTQAAMVKYAQVCTERDEFRTKFLDAHGRCEWQADTIERLERELAEANTTIEGLGMRNTEVERLLEHKQFLDEDRAHARRMDGERDQ